MLSVGELLRTEREKKGLTLKQVEKSIKVREKFLQAIENNNWNIFSSKIYITGIIKNYAHFLGLNEEKLIAFFRREYAKKDELKFQQKVKSSHLNPESRKYAFLGLGIIFFLFFIYFGYQILLYISPPKVNIISPKQGEQIFKADRIRIIGKTEKEASIIIFGERVYQNKDGIFEYDFPLKQGNNEFIAEVTGANGKKTIFRRTFVRAAGIF